MTKYNLDDLLNKKYGQLTIIEAYRKTKKSLIYCNCQCDCGNIAYDVQYSSLLNGTTKSCGCLHDKLSSERLSQQKKKYNTYKKQDDYMVGICNDGSEFIFDEEDYEKIKRFCWYKNKYGYVVSYNPDTGRVIFFHRYIMNCPDGYEVDHIYHNISDNRKSKLRICTTQQNSFNKQISVRNTSGHKNVKPKNGKWEVVVRHKYIGVYDSYDKACEVEEKAEVQMYGKYSIYSEIK